jgi:hypothetical protein
MRLCSAARVLLALSLVLVGVSGARADLHLSDLLAPGATFANGDKLFSDFAYTADAGMPLASAIAVKGFTDMVGNLGIGFFGAWINSTTNTALHSTIEFTVTVTDPNKRISDLHMFGDPNVSGTANGTDGTAKVTETVFAGLNGVGQLEIHDDVTGGIDSKKLSDSMNVTPVTSLRIVKDMLFNNRGGTPSMTTLEQSFSQVPEPAFYQMAALLGLGGFGVLRLRRKNTKNP